MADQTLQMLVSDAAGLADKLQDLCARKQWSAAHASAKQLLGLTSKAFQRLDGIVGALEELGQQEG